MIKGILFVPFMTGKGGTETVINNLFAAYHESTTHRDYQLTVYSIGGSFDYGWAAPIDNFKVKFISSHRFLRTAYYLTCLPFHLFRVIRRERPDFIISTNPVMWYLSYRIVKLLSLHTKVISWYHYSLERKPVKSLFLQAADYYLAISSAIQKELVTAGISPDRVFTIFNPITTDQVRVTRPQQSARFIYLGRLDLDGQKNLRDLINACTLLKGNWHLDLFGDETKAQPVKEYVQEQGVNDHLTFQGFVSQPWQHIKAASALVLCSNFEGYPMVLAEAMSHGVFCIASDIDGSNELVNSRNGVLYRLKDYQQLADRMQAVIDRPAALPDQTTIQESVAHLLPANYLARFDRAISEVLKG